MRPIGLACDELHRRGSLFDFADRDLRLAVSPSRYWRKKTGHVLTIVRGRTARVGPKRIPGRRIHSCNGQHTFAKQAPSPETGADKWDRRSIFRQPLDHHASACLKEAGTVNFM